MIIIGCDFHTRYQQIAMLDEATGELTERRLDHQNGEAEAFYRNLQGSAGGRPFREALLFFDMCNASDAWRRWVIPLR